MKTDSVQQRAELVPLFPGKLKIVYLCHVLGVRVCAIGLVPVDITRPGSNYDRLQLLGGNRDVRNQDQCQGNLKKKAGCLNKCQFFRKHLVDNNITTYCIHLNIVDFCLFMGRLLILRSYIVKNIMEVWKIPLYST